MGIAYLALGVLAVYGLHVIIKTLERIETMLDNRACARSPIGQ